MNAKALKGETLLLVTAVIWGTSFVAQKEAMRFVGPFTYCAVRFLIAAFVMYCAILILEAFKPRVVMAESGVPVLPDEVGVLTDGALAGGEDAASSDGMIGIPEERFFGIPAWIRRHPLLSGGLICGTVLFAGSAFQQVGMVDSTAGKGGFITALYIVLVPLARVFTGAKLRKLVWLAVAIATAGLYFISVNEDFSIQLGDFIIFLGTFFWAGHILSVDHFSSRTSGLKLSCLQFLVGGAWFLLATLAFERPSFDAIIACAGPILYSAIFVSGVAFTLQIIGQKTTDPTIASLIMSLEAVFAALSGMIILGERMSLRETAGCVLVFLAVIVAQLPGRKVKTS